MKILILTLFIAVLSINAGALSVVSDHLANDTLLLEEGSSKIYGVRLQNPGSEEIRLQITYDKDTSSIVDYEETYAVPPQSSKPIFFNVSAPPGANPGKTYLVSFTVHELSGSGQGVPILLKISKSLKVKIIKDPDKFYIDELKQFIPQAAIAGVILILVIIKFIKRKGIKLKRENRWKF